MRHAAQRNTRSAHRAALHVERRGDRDECKRVARAVPDLQVCGLGEARCGQLNGRDQLAVLEVRIALRRVAGQPVKLAQRNRALTFGAAHAHHRVERGERHGHVGRMHGDALVARAEDGVDAVVAFERGAAGAGIALVALGEGAVIEVIAARALEQIAADRRHVA